MNFSVEYMALSDCYLLKCGSRSWSSWPPLILPSKANFYVARNEATNLTILLARRRHQRSRADNHWPLLAYNTISVLIFSISHWRKRALFYYNTQWDWKVINYMLKYYESPECTQPTRLYNFLSSSNVILSCFRTFRTKIDLFCSCILTCPQGPT
jgi:hypothetical protein